MTERIAGMSLTTVLILLIALTTARAGLYATRVVFLRLVGDVFESVILAVALVFLILRPFVVQSFFIPTGSMHPTLQEGDHLLVNKWVYRTQGVGHGDVIVFHAPPEAAPDEKEFIKRVVGVPGDTIEVQAGYVTVGPTVFTRDAIRSVLGENRSVDEITSHLPTLRLQTDGIWLGETHFSPEDFARACGRPFERVQIQPGRVLRNDAMLMECYVAEDAQYDMPPRIVPPGCLFVMGDNRNDSRDSHVWGMLPGNRIIGRADWVFWPFTRARRIESQ